MLTWARHAILKAPTDEEQLLMEPADLLAYWKNYHDVIKRSEDDPYRHGFVLENWKRMRECFKDANEVLALGGNRASKTCGGAWLVVNCAMSNPKSLIVCFSQNAELSVLVQQAAVYKALPAELKQKTLGSNEYISFTSQNGFAGSSFILPNGSRVLFKTYSQFSQNNTVLEGMELGSYEPTSVNLGAWCDEYLGGPELINTLVFRLATRNAKMLLTFTPIDGYTQTVRDYLDGATTLEWKKAEALNNIDVPYVQKSKNKDAYIIYLHTKDNPFSGYERVLKEAKAKDEEWIKTRLYGIPTKSITSLFPRFDVKVNVVKHEAIPTKNVTRYLIIDPAGRKNWFMAWIAVDESGTWWVYREWPDINVGAWGQWRGNKWTAGEGCKSLGMGIKDYVDLINNFETGENIFERIIDPRLGQAKYSHERGQSSIIEDLADNGIICHAAPGLHEDDGLQSLQSKMAWINTKPLDALNRPHFYVSERCENIIWALQEYTGTQGPDEQAKDPIDVLRYAAVSDIYYVDPKDFKNSPRRSGGY